MQTTKQFSVQLVNKPGRLSAVLAALNKDKVGTRAFCVMDSGARATLRFIPSDPQRAAKALEAASISFDVADVLLVEALSQSGGLPKICQRLAEEHLNIDYCYGSLNAPVGARKGNLAVIKVNDLAKAQRVLGEPAGAANAKPKKRTIRRPAFTL